MQYCVVICNPIERSEIRHNNGDTHRIFYEFNERKSEEGRFSVLTANEWSALRKVFFFQREEEAHMAASEMAYSKPGCQIFVCKSENMYESIPSEAIKKKVTEKGILPV